MSERQSSVDPLSVTPLADGALRDLLREELEAAEARHLADGIGCAVRARVSLGLLARAKTLTGLDDTEQVLHAALVHLVMGRGADGGH